MYPFDSAPRRVRSAEVQSRPAPILILGPPRSGTTWVEQILGAAAHANVIHEPDNETCDPFALRAKRALGRFPILGPGDLAPSEYVELWERALMGRNRRASARWLVARAVLGTADADLGAVFDRRAPQFPARMRVVSALAVPPTAPPQKKRVLVKSVHASLAAEWIAARWNPQVVVVLRHPLNIIASHVALRWRDSGLATHPLLPGALSRIPGVPPLAADASPLSRLTWQIGLFIAALEAAILRNPHWLVVRHDELCADPPQRFPALCEALGLPWTERAAALLAASNRPGNGLATRRVAAEQAQRWRRQLDGQQLDEVVAVLSQFCLGSFDRGAIDSDALTRR
ncbi:MAG TPA: sulfotransferase [Acidimicrobiia bacterium]|nr:sulfotransferase [Acidimicrobiia bacterium]